MSSKISNKAEIETLDQLLKRLKIQNWDLLLIGDGSGSNWNFECGWGCVSIEHATFARRAWYGSMSAGTVNFAEMMAYLQPLCWYVNREMVRRKQPNYKTKVRQIHIITDSQYVKTKGSGKDLLTGKNGALWQVFSQFGAQGMILNWHWIRRETVELNQFADQLSKAARLNIKGKDGILLTNGQRVQLCPNVPSEPQRTDLPTQVEEGSFKPPKTIYEFNPAE